MSIAAAACKSALALSSVSLLVSSFAGIGAWVVKELCAKSFLSTPIICAIKASASASRLALASRLDFSALALS